MPRKKKKDDAVILKIILEVIIKVGATRFTLEDLSKKTGLSPGTLLQRFGSKRNILHQAMELAHHDLKENLDKEPAIHLSPKKEIIRIYLALASSFDHPRDVAGGLDILKLDIIEKKLNALARNYFTIRRAKIESLLLLAQEKKEIAANIKVSEMTGHLEALWQGYIILWALTGDQPINQWLTKRFESFFESIQ